MLADPDSVRQSSLRGHRSAVNSVNFSLENAWTFATGSDDATVRVWDLRTQKAHKCMHGCFEGQAVDSVVFRPRSSVSHLHATAGQYIYTFDLRKEGVLDKDPIHSINACGGDQYDVEVDCLGIHSSGETILAGDSNGLISVINPNNYETIMQLSGVHSSVVTSVSLSTDGSSLVSGALDCSLCRWDMESGQPAANPISFNDLERLRGGSEELGQMLNPPFVHAASFACEDACILCVNGDGSVNLFDSDTMSLLDTVPQAHTSMIGALHVSDVVGSSFLTGGNDRVIQAWIITEDDEGEGEEENGQNRGLKINSMWKLLHAEKINGIAGPLGDQPFDGSSFVVVDPSCDVKVYMGIQ